MPVRGALAGLEVEGRILLPAPTPCDCAQSPVSVALPLEGQCLSLPPLLPPAPSITPGAVGTLGGPGIPRMRPQASPSLSSSQRKVGERRAG